MQKQRLVALAIGLTAILAACSSSGSSTAPSAARGHGGPIGCGLGSGRLGSRGWRRHHRARRLVARQEDHRRREGHDPVHVHAG